MHSSATAAPSRLSHSLMMRVFRRPLETLPPQFPIHLPLCFRVPSQPFSIKKAFTFSTQTSDPSFLKSLKYGCFFPERKQLCSPRRKHGSIRQLTTAKSIFPAITLSGGIEIGTAVVSLYLYETTSHSIHVLISPSTALKLFGSNYYSHVAKVSYYVVPIGHQMIVVSFINLNPLCQMLSLRKSGLS